MGAVLEVIASEVGRPAGTLITPYVQAILSGESMTKNRKLNSLKEQIFPGASSPACQPHPASRGQDFRNANGKINK